MVLQSQLTAARWLLPRHLVHSIDQKRDGIGIRRSLDPMAKIEDVAGCRSSVFQHPINLTSELLAWREQRRRIQVALHGGVGSEDPAGIRERQPPVDSDHVRTALGYGPQ